MANVISNKVKRYKKCYYTESKRNNEKPKLANQEFLYDAWYTSTCLPIVTELIPTVKPSNEKLEGIWRECLGETALLIDRDDFTSEQFVLVYCNAEHVETAFKQMKNPNYLNVRPIFHWLDEKIRIYA